VLGLLNYVLLQHPSEESIESVQTTLRDPNDVEILASLIEYKPDYALTGDKDLLTNDVQSIFPTCRCADFIREFKSD
jgi:predicted nucleic acid-binding protein